MNTTTDPKDAEPHYRHGPHILSHRLHEANDRRYLAQETLRHLQEDLHKFRQLCETYKALAVAIAENNRPLAGRPAARLLQAGWAPATVLGVTSCPPPRTRYMHNVRILYMSILSLPFNICEQFWYQRCMISVEIGGDVLALGIGFI